MKTKLKDVVHLYIGQTMISYWGERKEFQTIEGVVNHSVIFRYNHEQGSAKEFLDMNYNFLKGTEPKLLLRPWSSVTEKDMEPFHKITTPINEGSIGQAQAIHWAKRINFLRSIGVDCDGLIDSGQAIDSTL